jgi:hypothetical protein
MDLSQSSTTKNWCYVCGEEVKGNVRPEIEVGIKCSRCMVGEAEYVKNHPDEYPIPEMPKKKRATRNKKWDKKILGKTLKDC